MCAVPCADVASPVFPSPPAEVAMPLVPGPGGTPSISKVASIASSCSSGSTRTYEIDTVPFVARAGGVTSACVGRSLSTVNVGDSSGGEVRSPPASTATSRTTTSTRRAPIWVGSPVSQMNANSWSFGVVWRPTIVAGSSGARTRSASPVTWNVGSRRTRSDVESRSLKRTTRTLPVPVTKTSLSTGRALPIVWASAVKATPPGASTVPTMKRRSVTLELGVGPRSSCHSHSRTYSTPSGEAARSPVSVAGPWNATEPSATRRTRPSRAGRKSETPSSRNSRRRRTLSLSSSVSRTMTRWMSSPARGTSTISAAVFALRVPPGPPPPPPESFPAVTVSSAAPM